MKRSRKLTPLTFQEHEKLAKDLLSAQRILEPWLEKLWQAYGVKCKEASQLHQTLILLSSKMSCQLDNRWYEVPVYEETDEKYRGHSSPYFESGKVVY